MFCIIGFLGPIRYKIISWNSGIKSVACTLNTLCRHCAACKPGLCSRGEYPPDFSQNLGQTDPA